MVRYYLQVIIESNRERMAKNLHGEIKNIYSLQKKFEKILIGFSATLAFFKVSETANISLLTNQVAELFNNYIEIWPPSLQNFIDLIFVVEDLEYEVQNLRNSLIKKSTELSSAAEKIKILERLPQNDLFRSILKRLLRQQRLVRSLNAISYQPEIEEFAFATVDFYTENKLYLDESGFENSLKFETITFKPSKNTFNEEYTVTDSLKNKLFPFKYSRYTLHYMQLCKELKGFYPEKTEADIRMLIKDIVRALYVYSDFFNDFDATYWHANTKESTSPIIGGSDPIQIIPYIKTSLDATKELRYSIERKIESIYQIGKELSDEVNYATYLLTQQLTCFSDNYFSEISRIFLSADNSNRALNNEAAMGFLEEASKAIEAYKLTYEGYSTKNIDKEKNSVSLLMRILSTLLNCIKKLFCIPTVTTSPSQFFTPINPASFQKIKEEGTALLSIIDEEYRSITMTS